MTYSIDRAAVIGAGVMGSTLAAHLANAGIPTLLLDIVPPEDSGVVGETSSREYRDAFARGGLAKALKASPAPFYTKDGARLVSPGNIEDDLDRLAGVDWVLEAIVENPDVKESLFKRIEPHLKDTAILTSNTSGLSVADMARGIGEPLRSRFLVTHFFNPPRYMHLLEIVPHEGTDPDLVDFMARFGAGVLGKGVVFAKDTPNFIANRIGTYSMAITLNAMIDGHYTVEEVDALTGPLIGRPRSATLRTADLVGVDILAHTSRNVYERAVDDEQRDVFKLPELIGRMIESGRLGRKTGQGFYKKTKKAGKSEILTLDGETFEYRERRRPSFPSLEFAKPIAETAERIQALLAGKDRAAEFLWKILSETMVYSALRAGEIADDIGEIDRAMRWGFRWELGPFELWDALGVESIAARLEKEGRPVPDIVREVMDTEAKSFYSRGKNLARSYFVPGVGHEPSPEAKATIDLEVLKRGNRTVKENAGSSLIDVGDGVLCLEFHSKMNAIGADIAHMIFSAVKEVEQNYAALIIGNHGENFSVGANIMLLLFEAQEGNWEEIDMAVRLFQKANMALKYCKRPVVAAPFGMALGGGCEVCLGAGHVYASAETYMGLVELGVGLVPAAGGCKEFLLRQLEGRPMIDGVDYFPFVRAAFETIGGAKVTTSAEEARQLRFLRRSDGISLNPQRLLYYAKAMAMGLAAQGYRPPDPTIQIPVVGESGIASIKTHLYMLSEGKHISEYDAYLGGELATVLCGGRVQVGTLVSEQYLLDLERQAFMRLLGQRKTLERIQYMLKKGKPLRN